MPLLAHSVQGEDMPVVYKQPSERFQIFYDFENDLNDTESILLASSSVAVEDKAGIDATAALTANDSLVVVGTKLYVTIRGGEESKSPYHVSLKAGTDEGGHVYEHDPFIVVEED